MIDVLLPDPTNFVLLVLGGWIDQGLIIRLCLTFTIFFRGGPDLSLCHKFYLSCLKQREYLHFICCAISNFKICQYQFCEGWWFAKCAPPVPRARQIAEIRGHKPLHRDQRLVNKQPGKIKKGWMTFCSTQYNTRFGGDQLKEKQLKVSRAMLGTTVKCGYLLHYKSKSDHHSNSEPKTNIIFQRELLGEIGPKKLWCFILIAGGQQKTFIQSIFNGVKHVASKPQCSIS